MDWLPFSSVLSTLVASVITYYFGHRARDLNTELSAIEEAADSELDDVLKEAREGALKPDEVVLRKEQASATRAKKDDVARQRDRSMAVAVVGAVAVVLSAVATPVASAYFSRPAVECPEQIASVIAIVAAHPEAWVPLNSDDTYQVTCHLNQVAEQVKRAAKTPSAVPSPS